MAFLAEQNVSWTVEVRVGRDEASDLLRLANEHGLQVEMRSIKLNTADAGRITNRRTSLMTQIVTERRAYTATFSSGSSSATVAANNYQVLIAALKSAGVEDT